jgi:isovaleryl-CoA dehydrogenase
MGATTPEENGGAGMDAVAAVTVHHKLSKYELRFCLAYPAHSMLFTNNFYFSAPLEQQRRWLPRALYGEHMGAMGCRYRAPAPTCSGCAALPLRTRVVTTR